MELMMELKSLDFALRPTAFRGAPTTGGDNDDNPSGAGSSGTSGG